MFDLIQIQWILDIVNLEKSSLFQISSYFESCKLDLGSHYLFHSISHTFRDERRNHLNKLDVKMIFSAQNFHFPNYSLKKLGSATIGQDDVTTQTRTKVSFVQGDREK